MKKKILSSFIVGFASGVFCYALYLYRADVGIAVKQSINFMTGQETDTSVNENHTYVTYDGVRFKPNRVSMPISGYLYITNISAKEKMWLESDHPYLTTPRPYGETEQIKVRLDSYGSYTVRNKMNPEATIEVTVR